MTAVEALASVKRVPELARQLSVATRRADVELALEPTWRRDRMAVTVFLQDGRDLEVLAAAAARPR